MYKKGPGSSLSIMWKEIVSSSSLATTRPQTHVCLWDPSLRLGPEGKEQAFSYIVLLASLCALLGGRLHV